MSHVVFDVLPHREFGAVLPDAESMGVPGRLLPAERKIFPTHTGRISHGRGGVGWTAGLSVLSMTATILRFCR